MRQADNIFINKPTSFNQFFRAAYNLISNSFAYHQPRSLQNSITDLLTQNQIDQHNLIQIKSFELSKEIKSKFTRFNQQEIANVLIKVKNILEEMEKLCTSLKVKFLFELFEQLALCLTMVAALNYSVGPGKIVTESPPKKRKPSQELDGISTDLKNSVGTSKKIGKTEKITPALPIKSEARIRNKLGGITLYNQNYKRHIENRQLLISLNNVIRDSENRQQFWGELKRDYKQTIGTSGQESKPLKQLQNKTEQFKQLGISLRNSRKQIVKNQSQTVTPEIIIEPQACHSTNAHNMLCNSSLFYYELDSFDFSNQSLQKTIDEITLTYQNEKFVTLDSIKKIVGKFWSLVEEKIQEFQKLMKAQQQKIEHLKLILSHRLDNTLQVGIQTSSYMSQGYLTQCEKLRLDVKKLEHVVDGMESIISRQNRELIDQRKKNIGIERKIELKEKKCTELQKQIQTLQKNIQISRSRCQNNNNNKIQIESHLVTKMDIGDALNNVSLSNDLIDQKIKELDFVTERLLNYKNSQDRGSIRGQLLPKNFHRKGGRNITFLDMIDDESNQNDANDLIKKSKFKSERMIRTENHGVNTDILRQGRSLAVIPAQQRKAIRNHKRELSLKPVQIGFFHKNQKVKPKESTKNIVFEGQIKYEYQSPKSRSLSKSKSKSRKQKLKQLNFSSRQCEFLFRGSRNNLSQDMKENEKKQFSKNATPSSETLEAKQKKQKLSYQTRLSSFHQKFKKQQNERNRTKLQTGIWHHNSTQYKKRVGMEQGDEESKPVERNNRFDFGSFQKWNIEKTYGKDFREEFDNLTLKNKKPKNKYVSQAEQNHQNEVVLEKELHHEKKNSKLKPYKVQQGSQNQLKQQKQNSENNPPKKDQTNQMRLNKKLKKLSNALLPSALNSFSFNTNPTVLAENQTISSQMKKARQSPHASVFLKQFASNNLNLGFSSNATVNHQNFQHSSFENGRNSQKINYKKTSKRKTYRARKVNIGQFC